MTGLTKETKYIRRKLYKTIDLLGNQEAIENYRRLGILEDWAITRKL